MCEGPILTTTVTLSLWDSEQSRAMKWKSMGIIFAYPQSHIETGCQFEINRSPENSSGEFASLPPSAPGAGCSPQSRPALGGLPTDAPPGEPAHRRAGHLFLFLVATRISAKNSDCSHGLGHKVAAAWGGK